ncbi:hypothetical protein M096_1578 [Parabacteroides distasonis str. 3999B T(B) 6]|nr:hypothetical protein M096_1578 [Parabacteroides distasonis str. 3999B T(B) 6]
MKVFHFLTFSIYLNLNNGYIHVSSLFIGAFLFSLKKELTFTPQK